MIRTEWCQKGGNRGGIGPWGQKARIEDSSWGAGVAVGGASAVPRRTQCTPGPTARGPNPRAPKGTPGRRIEFLPGPKTALGTAVNVPVRINWR